MKQTALHTWKPSKGVGPPSPSSLSLSGPQVFQTAGGGTFTLWSTGLRPLPLHDTGGLRKLNAWVRRSSNPWWWPRLIFDCVLLGGQPPTHKTTTHLMLHLMYPNHKNHFYYTGRKGSPRIMWLKTRVLTMSCMLFF